MQQVHETYEVLWLVIIVEYGKQAKTRYGIPEIKFGWKEIK